MQREQSFKNKANLIRIEYKPNALQPLQTRFIKNQNPTQAEIPKCHFKSEQVDVPADAVYQLEA